ncbi:hypothetical protein SK803_02970 [Lentzea sp. BCCO 10_0856]|uniref:Lipoprotein n=1 Tax=Lentzea miocenica TaxID=3095431 RepID=A0ABU4STB8_9PSEU|nr:hypothetical protein [Lentzea sp. BCCO 10_0856]MDX8029152.1 hypothetical protein [Lentzea sp. BCCO 10_0856]
MRRVVLPVLLLVAVVSCARPEAAGIGGQEMTTGPATTTYSEPPDTTSYPPGFNNEDLHKAAEALKPLLEGEFATTYSRLTVRDNVPMLVIYRKPNPRFEAEVWKTAPNVRIDFRDARYSYAELSEHQRRLMNDIEHWKTRGITINSAGLGQDGSALDVGTETDPPKDVVRQLEAHYPGMSFKVERIGEIVPATR